MLVIKPVQTSIFRYHRLFVLWLNLSILDFSLPVEMMASIFVLLSVISTACTAFRASNIHSTSVSFQMERNPTANEDLPCSDFETVVNCSLEFGFHMTAVVFGCDDDSYMFFTTDRGSGWSYYISPCEWHSDEWYSGKTSMCRDSILYNRVVRARLMKLRSVKFIEGRKPSFRWFDAVEDKSRLVECLSTLSSHWNGYFVVDRSEIVETCSRRELSTNTTLFLGKPSGPTPKTEFEVRPRSNGTFCCFDVGQIATCYRNLPKLDVKFTFLFPDGLHFLIVSMKKEKLPGKDTRVLSLLMA